MIRPDESGRHSGRYLLHSLIIGLVLACFIMAFDKPSGHDQRLNEQSDSIVAIYSDSIKIYRDSLHQRERAYLKAFSECIRAKDRQEGEINFWKAKVKK